MSSGSQDIVDIERHLQEALERADDSDARYHIRQALQKLLVREW